MEGEFFLLCLQSSTAGFNSPPSGLTYICASPARHLASKGVKTFCYTILTIIGFCVFPKNK